MLCWTDTAAEVGTFWDRCETLHHTQWHLRRLEEHPEEREVLSWCFEDYDTTFATLKPLWGYDTLLTTSNRVRCIDGRAVRWSPLGLLWDRRWTAIGRQPPAIVALPVDSATRSICALANLEQACV